MKKFLTIMSLIITLLLVTTLTSKSNAQAASALADGTYLVDYTITKAENDSVSMANDYWEKPAKVTIENGQATVQLQLNHSKWVTVFKVSDKDSFVDTKVISSDKDEDTRVVRFQVEDISKPLLSKIHVTVESIDYDHDYTIRFLFNLQTAKTAGSAAETSAVNKADSAKETTSASTTGQASNATSDRSAHKASDASAVQAEKKKTAVTTQAAVANPKTGDSFSLPLLVSLMLVSSLYVAYRIRKWNK